MVFERVSMRRSIPMVVGFVMLLVSVTLSLMQALRSTSASEPRKSQWYSLPLSEMTRTCWWHVCGGVLLVTFANPMLSNYALFKIALALALTLGSIGPLYALPLSFALQNERPTARSILGAFLAVAGVVVLSLKGTVPDGE